MDNLEQLRDVIEKVLTDYKNFGGKDDIETRTVFDREHDQYLLVHVGWQNDIRMHGCLIHIEIIKGKIWIQYDGTEDGIALDLEKEGIAKDQIVLGFHPADIRPHTEYAAT